MKRNYKTQKGICFNPKLYQIFKSECKHRALSMSGLIDLWIKKQLTEWGVCPEDKTISNYEKIEVKNAKP